MSKPLGATFKKIRIGKKMSLRDVSGDYLSVSFLSKFERGESEITISRLLMLLENLNVSIEEFYKLSTEETPSKLDLLISKTSQAYYNNNILALRKYKSDELEKYEKTETSMHLYNSIMIEAFICSINNEKIDEESSKILADYLFGVEYWGKYELMLLGNSMSVLPVNTLKLLVDEITKKTRLFGSIDENYIAKITLLINAAYTCIYLDDLDSSKKYLDQLSDMTIPDRLLYEKFEIQFAKGLYNIKSGNIELGTNEIENLFLALKIIGSEQLLIAREEAYKQIINSYI